MKKNVRRILKDRLPLDGYPVLNHDTMIPFPAAGQQRRFRERIRKLLAVECDRQSGAAGVAIVTLLAGIALGIAATRLWVALPTPREPIITQEASECSLQDVSEAEYKGCLGTKFDQMGVEIETMYTDVVSLAETKDRPWILKNLTPYHEAWRDRNLEWCLVNELPAADGSGYGLEVLTCEIQRAHEYAQALRSTRDNLTLYPSLVEQ